MKKNKKEETQPTRKKSKTLITSSRKAIKVLQSNGLAYFKKWAEQSFTGGKRLKASRPSFRSENPKLYDYLLTKGELLNRKMDRKSKKG